jgi:hypothetical protein
MNNKKIYEQKDLVNAIQNNNFEEVVFLVKKQKINPTFINNWAIHHASTSGFIDITRFLLSDKRVDPTNDGINLSIHSCYNDKLLENFSLLFHHKKVNKQLKKENIKLFEKYEEFLNSYDTISKF